MEDLLPIRTLSLHLNPNPFLYHLVLGLAYTSDSIYEALQVKASDTKAIVEVRVVLLDLNKIAPPSRPKESRLQPTFYV